MRVEGFQLQALLAEMERSFNDGSLDRLLTIRFGLRLHNVTAEMKAGSEKVFDVVGHFNRFNTTEQLVAALRDSRPSVGGFARLADAAGFSSPAQSAALEAHVTRPESPYQDAVSFRADLARREAAVCQVRVGDVLGTGFLVANDLVLTNFHVVAGAMDAQCNLIASITCRFDHKASITGYVTPAVDVSVTSVISSSPYGQEDLSPGNPSTSDVHLDYALLRLARVVGETPVIDGGEPRGTVSIVNARTAAVNEGVLVLQHPLGEPMKIDIGAVTFAGAVRMRHTVNTDKGSSGAPVFDGALNLVALHHAGYDWPSGAMPFNQGVPVALILKHARQMGVAI